MNTLPLLAVNCDQALRLKPNAPAGTIRSLASQWGDSRLSMTSAFTQEQNTLVSRALAHVDRADTRWC